VALGKGVGDTVLIKIVIDGLIGPKTTEATNRAFTRHIGSGQAPASLRTGKLTQSEVVTRAETLAAYIDTELVRRGFSAPPVKIVTPKKTTTTKKTTSTALIPTTYTSTASLPAATMPSAFVPAAESDTRTQIVKWAAIGLGGVVVAGVIYYLWRQRQGRPAFGEFGEITLHERIAQALSWPLRDVESLSLPSLRELVRPVDQRLAEEISESITYHQDLTQRSREKPFRVGRRSGRLGDGERYKTFIRSASASHWGRKRTVDTGLTYDEARRACQQYNTDRTTKQINAGTKMEFTQE
jgi:hypothetical protein